MLAKVELNAWKEVRNPVDKRLFNVLDDSIKAVLVFQLLASLSNPSQFRFDTFFSTSKAEVGVYSQFFKGPDSAIFMGVNWNGKEFFD